MGNQQDLDELYRLGFQARSNSNFERAIFYWGQILQIDANFQNGFVKQEYDKAYVEHLRLLAYEAYITKQIDQELAIWNDVLKIDPANTDAQTSINIINQNHSAQWLYDQVNYFVTRGDNKSAYDQLVAVLNQAPYHYDPLRLAQRLNTKIADHPIHIREQSKREKIQQEIIQKQQTQREYERQQEQNRIEYERKQAQLQAEENLARRKRLQEILNVIFLFPCAISLIFLVIVSGEIVSDSYDYIIEMLREADRNSSPKEGTLIDIPDLIVSLISTCSFIPAMIVGAIVFGVIIASGVFVLYIISNAISLIILFMIFGPVKNDNKEIYTRPL